MVHDVRLRVYLEAAVERAQDALGEQLVGVYAMGSVALGDWHPGSSDVDVAVVCSDGVDRGALRYLADVMADGALPVPARKLELVVYEEGRLRRGDPTFVLNLNTGPGETTADYDPAAVPGFWFVLDVAIAREHAVTLVGPPPREVFGEIPTGRVRAALYESLDWYAGAEGTSGATVLAYCRTLRHLECGDWLGKTAAARWAAERVPAAAAAIDAALTQRR